MLGAVCRWRKSEIHAETEGGTDTGVAIIGNEMPDFAAAQSPCKSATEDWMKQQHGACR